MNWKECGRRRPEPDLRHYHGIHLEGLRKSTTFCGQDIRRPDRDLNPNLPTATQIRILIGLKWHRICLNDETFVTAAMKSMRIIATVQTSAVQRMSCTNNSAAETAENLKSVPPSPPRTAAGTTTYAIVALAAWNFSLALAQHLPEFPRP
jgi:hypothetical protein